MSIKVRVFLLIALLLLFPLLGVQYLRESERSTRALESDYLKDRVVDISQLVNFSLGTTNTSPSKTPAIIRASNKQSLFFYPLSSSPQIDGYDDEEWVSIPAKTIDHQSPGFSLRAQSGIHRDKLFIRLVVNDDTPQPHNYYHSLLANGDYFGVRLGNRRTYYFRLYTPGNIDVYRLGRGDTLRSSSDIEAAWQPMDGGYQIELALEQSTAEGKFGFFVVNSAGNQQGDIAQQQEVVANIDTRFRQSGIYTVVDTGVPPSYQSYQFGLAEVLSRFASPGMRLHVCDPDNNLLATAGQLAISEGGEQIPWIVKDVYQWLLASDAVGTYPRDKAFDCKAGLQGRSIDGGVQLWSKEYANDLLSYAALPLSSGPYAGGIFVAQQSRDRYVMFTNRTFASYLFYTLGVSLLIVVAMSGYLFIWSWRLSRLNKSARQHVDDTGDVSSGFKVSKSADEIGELSRNMGSLLEQIRAHNDYLKTLAQKLSHEMKTPLAIVSTSLDNIDSNESTRVYLERAQDGVHRLSHIMSSMGQAKKLEQAIEYAEFAPVDIAGLLSGACEAYQKVYGEHTITFVDKTNSAGIQLNAASELLIQMLDKLVDNAVDFSERDSEIVVEIERSGNNVLVRVINRGSQIEEDMVDTLFQQLVTFRDKGGDKPHLGLGLFIARLIAEHHKGSINAQNLDDGSGVCFTVSLPI